jgi:uncharacterized protein (DUF433 family)
MSASNETGGRRSMINVSPAIVRDPERCGGKPTIAGTRIGVHHVISYLNLYGGDLERVHAEALEHLSMDQLQAAVVWYHDHRDQIDAILQERAEDYERGVSEAVAA